MAQASRTVRRPWDLKVTSSVAQLDPLIRTTAMQDAARLLVEAALARQVVLDRQPHRERGLR